MSRSQRSWTLFKRSIEIVGSNKSLLRLRTSIERGSFMRRTICVVIALAGAGFGLLAFAADEGSTVPTKDPVVIEFMTALKLQEKYEAERVAKQDENAASLADQKLPEAKRKKMAAANKKVDALVRAEAGWDSVKDDIAKGYHTLCGDDEMRQIIVFLKTPIGKKMIETEVAVVPKAWAIREKTIMKTRDPKADKRSTVPAKDLLVTEFMTAFKLQEKYPDVYFMPAWANIFKEDTSQYRELSKLKNVLIVPLCKQIELVEMMRQTNIGLFPNRVEGGTNLVMMEYMACGKPVIANDSTGQADVIDDEYAFRINGGDLQLVESMVDRLEYAYLNRDVLEDMGKKADKAMDNFTWELMADRFLELANGKVT